MEAKIKLIQLGAVTEGVNKKGEAWRKGMAIFETDDKYPKKYAISFFNSHLEEVSKFKPGDICDVSFDIESREYNGKWYTELKGYKIAGQQAEQPKQSYDEPAPAIDYKQDDLPF